MSQQTLQLIEIAVVALLFAVGIVRLARLQLISFRYTVGWLALAVVALLAGVLIPLVGPIARILQVDEFTLVAAAAVILLLLVCIQLSISISGLQRQVRKIAEELALSRTKEESSSSDNS